MKKIMQLIFTAVAGYAASNGETPAYELPDQTPEYVPPGCTPTSSMSSCADYRPGYRNPHKYNADRPMMPASAPARNRP